MTPLIDFLPSRVGIRSLTRALRLWKPAPARQNQDWTQIQTRVKARTVQRRGLSHRVAYVSAAAVLDAEEKVADEVSSNKNMRFDSFRLSRNTQRALDEVLGYATCTETQAKSLPVCLTGVDVVTKARTGTGKTLAFLIPAIEQLRPQQGQIGIIVLSPTRELTNQIAVEAQQLCKFHDFAVQTMVGGTDKGKDVAALKRQVPHILVATPGRLLDHLEDKTLPAALRSVQTLVLDEADRLLDMGFKPAIDKIVANLPPKSTRQTLLFSATFPADIKQLSDRALRPGYVIVDAIGENEEQTAERVSQSIAEAPMDDLLPQLVLLIQGAQQADSNAKIMVFFTTARLTGVCSDLFNAMGLPVWEIHSRKSQSARTKAAQQFRDAPRGVLFTSDVSARGVDYPDVSHVMQVGLPANREQYIHRVGRTARAGKAGQAILLLHDFERRFARQISDMPVQRVGSPAGQALEAARAAVDRALVNVPLVAKEQAYQAWLGYYKGSLRLLDWTPEKLVQEAAHFAETLGCDDTPALQKSTIGKMGLKGVPGLVIGTSSSAGGGRQTQSFGGRPQNRNGSSGDILGRGAPGGGAPGFGPVRHGRGGGGGGGRANGAAPMGRGGGNGGGRNDRKRSGGGGRQGGYGGAGPVPGY